MSKPHVVEQRGRRSAGNARERLLAALPVAERRLQLAGVSTAVQEGGDGRPVILLHSPGGSAVHWSWVIPRLVASHRVVAPDLPGQGESHITRGSLDADRVLRWLGELIEQTCPSRPVLVGLTLGGAIAARFAASDNDRISGLVLVDALGLAPFQPAPEFGRALSEFLTQPTENTYDLLWGQCAVDLDSVRGRMGERWEAFRSYDLERARTPAVMSALLTLMELFGGPAIPAAELGRIGAPTEVIWGRHNRAIPLRIAEAACDRYGWPLHVIEHAGADPHIEQPEAFVDALRTALAPAR